MYRVNPIVCAPEYMKLITELNVKYWIVILVPEYQCRVRLCPTAQSERELSAWQKERESVYSLLISTFS